MVLRVDRARQIHLDGIVIIVGNYGSGKTEVSINLAVNRKQSGLEVRIADLDLVNPYFRVREARKRLHQLGIDVSAMMRAQSFFQSVQRRV